MAEEPEQDYSSEYVFFILLPALVSLLVSSLLLINFFFVSKHLQSFMYHQLSATLALFDVVQQIGTALGAPFLLGAASDTCDIREYLFLFGSFCKTLTVLFISGTISYVIHYSAVPTQTIMRRSTIALACFSVICFISMVLLEISDTLCHDPTAGNFDTNGVKQKATMGFAVLYLVPIGFSFAVTIVLIIHTGHRLRTMFNAALLKLLIRLIPGPVIFTLALVPAMVFQVIQVVSGQNVQALKLLALLGINFSGAMFAFFYFYGCKVDNSMYRPSERHSNTSARPRDTALSWATVEFKNNPNERQPSVSNVLHPTSRSSNEILSGNNSWSSSRFEESFEIDHRYNNDNDRVTGMNISLSEWQQ